MSYMSIENLYKNQMPMLFKRVWATEKIHGTSAHVKYDPEVKKLTFFPGGADYLVFASLFNYEELYKMMEERWGTKKVTLYGEHYGGKIMGMSATYGPKNRFVLFEVQIGDVWLSFEKVIIIGAALGIDVVPGRIADATIEALTAERERPSEQAVKCGIIEPKMREGIVIRPLVEMRMNNDERVIAKYKNDIFKETTTVREVDPNQQVILTEAEKIADEWVTEMRLTHVLDKLGNPNADKDIPNVLKAMREDIVKESTGEIIMSQEASKAISKKTAIMYRERLQKKLETGGP